MEQMKEQIISAFQTVRQQGALVHCITNAVTVNDCANMLLAAGAHPTMAHDAREVAEITTGCKSLVLNLGATEYASAIQIAAEQATRTGHPICLDPVGCGGSSFRREMVRELQKRAELNCIRGNASEIRALLTDQDTVVGVDARVLDEKGEGVFLKNQSVVRALAQQTKGVVVLSGAVDLISDGEQIWTCENGDPMMSKITGSGCMATAVLGAYLAAAREDGAEDLAYAVAAMSVLGICGESAAKKCRSKHAGTMTFRNYFIDQMYLLTEDQIREHIKIERI